MTGSLSNAWTVAAWTAIHFAWIGTAVAVVTYPFLLVARRRGPGCEYAVALTAFVLICLSPLAIAAYLLGNPSIPAFRATPLPSSATISPEHGPTIDLRDLPPPLTPTGTPTELAWPGSSADPIGTSITALRATAVSRGGVAQETAELPPANRFAAWASQWNLGRFGLRASPALRRGFNTLLAWLPAWWLAGSSSLLLLHGLGLAGGRRLRRLAIPVDDPLWRSALERTSRRLRLRRPPRLAICHRVGGPVLVGLLRPMILIPPAALCGWSPQEIELILVHELLHLRRRDHLVHFFQRVAETALFFHPCVWWYSYRLRCLRELCVDDQVVAVTDARQRYARLLASLAQSSGGPQLQLGNGLSMAEAPLVVRIRRLVTGEGEAMRLTRLQLAGGCGIVVLSLTAVALVLTTGWQRDTQRQARADRTAVAPVAGQNTEDPFGVQDDPFAGPAAGGEDPFGSTDQPFAALGQRNPFGDPSSNSGSDAGSDAAGPGANPLSAGQSQGPSGGQAAPGEQGPQGGVTTPVPPTPAASGHYAQIPRERLRYDGKTFNDWREELLTELKPERRLEAARAFVRFAPYGYQEEAVEALLSLARGYEWTGVDGSPDGQLQQIILDHLASADPKLIVGHFRTIQQSENIRLKRMAAWVALMMEKRAEPLVSMMLEYLDESEDKTLRQFAASALAPFAGQNPDARRALEEALGDEALRDTALAALYPAQAGASGSFAYGGYGAGPSGYGYGMAAGGGGYGSGGYGGYGPSAGYGGPAYGGSSYGAPGYGRAGSYGEAGGGYGSAEYGYGASYNALPDQLRSVAQNVLASPRLGSPDDARRPHPVPDELVEAILASPAPNISLLQALISHGRGAEVAIERFASQLSGDDEQRVKRAMEALLVLGTQGDEVARQLALQLASAQQDPQRPDPEDGRLMTILESLPPGQLRRPDVRKALDQYGERLDGQPAGALERQWRELMRRAADEPIGEPSGAGDGQP